MRRHEERKHLNRKRRHFRAMQRRVGSIKGLFLAATRLVSEVKRVILTSRAIYYLENNPNRINTGLVKVEIILKII